MHETRNPSDVPAPPGGWYSHTAAVPTGGGRLLFVAGQIALSDDGEIVSPGDMAGQSERVFELVSRALAAWDATFDDVVNIRTFVTDMAKLADYGEARSRYITRTPPTSTTVEVSRLFRPDAMVEVDVVAAVGGSS